MLIDANILLRLILQDNQQLFNAAKVALMQPEKTCIVSSIILAEVIYVLRGMGFERENTSVAIGQLLEHPSFVYDEPCLERALSNYTTSNLDFADCYLLARAKREKIKVLTLDKAIKKRLT